MSVAGALEVQERSIIQVVKEDTELSITENQSTLEVLAGAQDHIIDRRDTTRRAENESAAEASVPGGTGSLVRMRSQYAACTM